MAERRVIAKRAESAGDFSNRDRNAATHTDADAEQDRKNGRGTDSGARKEVENCVPEAHEAQYAANGGIGRGYERNGLLVRDGLRRGVPQKKALHKIVRRIGHIYPAKSQFTPRAGQKRTCCRERARFRRGWNRRGRA